MKRAQSLIIIDDDEILLDSYKYFIDSYEEFDLKGSYGSVREALSEYEDIYPDIVLTDISMPGMSGIDAVKKFKSLDESVKVIIISVHDDLSYILDSLKNSVDGYLTKPVNKKTLYNALCSLKNDGSPLSSDVSRKIMRLFKKEHHSMFSERESEIIEFLTKGYTYKAIGEKLYVTPSTINFHIQNIYSKLDVNSKYEALKRLEELKPNSF